MSYAKAVQECVRNGFLFASLLHGLISQAMCMALDLWLHDYESSRVNDIRSEIDL